MKGEMNEDAIQTAERRMNQAMLELRPNELKAAYHEACRFAPELVAKESDPRWFLRFHPFDPLAAARRMANYWMKRKEIFQERAFLPIINLSGHGAMTAEDVRVLQTGFWVNLPRDNKGRTVIYADISKRRLDTPPSLRTTFFIAQHAMENEVTRNDCFVILINISNPFAAQFVPGNVKCGKFLMEKCMPIKSLQFHAIHIPLGTSIDQSFINTIYKWGIDRLGSVFKESIITHVASSKEDCLHKLMEYDLSFEGLPVGLGGSWTAGCEPWGKGYLGDDDNDKNDDDDTSGDAALSLEIELDLSCLLRNALWCHNQTVANQQDQQQQEPSSLSLSNTQEQPWSRTNGSESLVSSITESGPAIAPTATSRCKNGSPMIQSQVVDSSSARSSRASSRDQKMQDDDEMYRMRKRNYGRRGRAKERIEIHVMVQEHHRLKMANQALRAEGERLEGLLHAAEQEVERHHNKTPE